MDPGLAAAATAAGGVLAGLIVSKLLNRTAASVADLPVLEYRVKHLEEKLKAQADTIHAHEMQLDAAWREFGKAKSFIDNAVPFLFEIAERNGLVPLNPPKWGPEP